MPYTPNNPYIPGDPYSYDLKWLVQNINKVESAIEYLKQSYTTPTVVDLAAEMTDKNKIYVYIGSEIGYLASHWYYYDPNTNLWTDGGLYGSITPDAALNATSTNAVENRVITNALATKFNTADIDSALSGSSTHPVQNQVIKNALDGKQNTITFPLAVSSGGTNDTTVHQDYGSITDVYFYYWGDIIVMDVRGAAVDGNGSFGTIPAQYRPIGYFYAVGDIEISPNVVVPARFTIEGNGNTLVEYYNGTKFVTATTGNAHANITILNRRAE